MANAGLGWCCITLGLVAGLVMGLWQAGNDADLARPWTLLRQACLGLLALGATNVLYVVSLHLLHASGHLLRLGAGLWAAAAVTLPVACALSAWRRRWPTALLFAVPVLCVLAAGAITSWGAWR